MGVTSIPWSDLTDNISHGCDWVSEGCGFLRLGDDASGGCYADRLARRVYGKDVGFKVTLEPGRMADCLKRQQPSRIFTVSMGDLFHKQVPFEFVAARWVVMGLCAGRGGPRLRRGHAFQILTKRPHQMAGFMERWCDPADRQRLVDEARRRGYLDAVLARRDIDGSDLLVGDWDPILPNVWLMVSIERNKYRWRVDKLLSIPACTRALSVEPLLGPTDLTGQLYTAVHRYRMGADWGPTIDQVIVGGESGPGARRMDPEWALDVLGQADAAGVGVFFKQTGEALAREWGLKDRRGEDPAELPDGLWQRREDPPGRWDPTTGWQLPVLGAAAT
jgi:protein gp37